MATNSIVTNAKNKVVQKLGQMTAGYGTNGADRGFPSSYARNAY